MTKRANEKIKIILEKILSGYSLSGLLHRSIEYPVNNLLKGVDITTAELELILERLEREDVLENVEDLDQEIELPEDQTYRIYFSDDFVKTAETYLNSLNKIGNKFNEKTGEIMLYLEKDGRLWHGDKEKCFYKMDSSKARMKTLKYLIENNEGDFIPTRVMANDLKKEAQNLRSELGKINSKVKNLLQIDNLIENIKGDGYRIDSKYKIIILE